MGVSDQVTVVVGTFGDSWWTRLAHDPAIPSAVTQAPVIHVHGETLHEARNVALEGVRTPYVVHLDADDELSPGYVAQMTEGVADIRAPAVQYVYSGHPRAPYVPKVAGHRHDCNAACLVTGNWIVVGACVRTDLVRAVGGWEPFAWSEDWALWARCWKAGASIEAIPAAVYVAHARPDSRNRGLAREAKDAAHWEIHRAVWPELYEGVT